MFNVFGLKERKMALIIVVFFFSLFSLFFIKYSQIAVDFGWIAEPAYNYVEHNQFATLSRAGWMDLEKGTLWWPPVYFVIEIILYYFFGFGMLQNILLLIAILGLVFIFSYKTAIRLFDEKVAILSLLLLVSNTIFFTLAFVENRPDVLVGLFNLFSFYMFLNYLKSKKSIFLFIGGIFTGLGAMSHFIGSFMTISLILCLFLYHKKEYKSALKKSVNILAGALIPIALWMIYALKNLEIFKSQFIDYRATYQTTTLQNLFMEPGRYQLFFGTPAMYFIAILFIAALVYGLKHRKNESIGYLTIILTTYMLLLSTISSKTHQHMAAIIPFWTILSAKLIYDLLNSKKEIVKKTTFLFFAAVFVFGLATHFAWIGVRAHTNDYSSMNEYLSEIYVLSENETVVATSPFLFVFKENLYDFEAIRPRVNSSAAFTNIISEINPKYFIVDAFIMGKIINGPDVNLSEDVKSYLKNNVTKTEELCFLKGNKVENPELYEFVYYSNKGYANAFLDAMRNPEICYDPIIIYEINN